MKVLIGFILGVILVFVLGMVYKEAYWIGGWLVTSPLYQSELSGIGPDGECYFALTSTTTGRTEIARIAAGEPNELSIQRYFSDKAFQGGRAGIAVYFPDATKEIDDYIQQMERIRR